MIFACTPTAVAPAGTSQSTTANVPPIAATQIMSNRERGGITKSTAIANRAISINQSLAVDTNFTSLFSCLIVNPNSINYSKERITFFSLLACLSIGLISLYCSNWPGVKLLALLHCPPKEREAIRVILSGLFLLKTVI